MNDPALKATQAGRLTLSTHLSDGPGYLVRLHPVVLGEGLVTLPQGTVIMGREGTCDLVLEDADVSRRHAALEFQDGMYRIRDLGSTNGTVVNQRRVKEHLLASGDIIRVGKVVLKFLRGSDVEKQYHETIYTMMISDGLTGIANKRYFLEALGRELSRSQRHGRPLSLVMMDLDHFKKVNDTYGHLAGDAVLRELCARVRKAIRSDEVFARYGGEEFAVLLPEATREQAALFADRIRQLAAAEPVDVEGTRVPITVSLGVAHTGGEAGVTAEELVGRADAKLYEAKKLGRNRVVA
jgi:diguanylate cyclase (GGDEF)-like protein